MAYSDNIVPVGKPLQHIDVNDNTRAALVGSITAKSNVIELDRNTSNAFCLSSPMSSIGI